MFYFNCDAGNYTVEVYAKKRSSLKGLLRRGMKAAVGTESAAYLRREYPSDYDTSDAQDFSWLDGKDFIMLDGKEVVWVEGRES